MKGKAQGTRIEAREKKGKGEREKRGSGEMAKRGITLIIRINESTHELIFLSLNPVIR
jgi:hypothetical protein